MWIIIHNVIKSPTTFGEPEPEQNYQTGPKYQMSRQQLHSQPSVFSHTHTYTHKKTDKSTYINTHNY